MDSDHELVGVARIAAEAGVSVGAFYGRFRSKDAFLALLVERRFHRAIEHARRDLDPAPWRDREPGEVVRGIVMHTVVTLHGPGAGIARTVLRRGHLDPTNLRPLLEYRAVVAGLAAGLLAGRMGGTRDPGAAARAMVQVVQATALDALLQDQGPLRAGRRATVAALADMMTRALGLGAMGTGRDGGDGDAQDDALIEMPVEDLVAVEVPVPARSPAPPPPSRRKAAEKPRVGPTATVWTEAAINPGRAAEPAGEAPSRRAPRRWL